MPSAQVARNTKRESGTILGVAVNLGIRSVAIGLALLLLVPATVGQRTDRAEALRSVTGQVLDRAEHPLDGAVVYLLNIRTQVVKSFITDDTGAFRFHALSPNTDYQVYAQYHGRKSDTKTLSAFDSRQNVTLYLHINMGEK